jgi:hypothetical protein
MPKKQRRMQRKRPLEVVQRVLLPKAQAPQRQIMTVAMLGPTASSAPVMRVVASPSYSIQSPSSDENHDAVTSTSSSAPVVSEKPRRIVTPRRITPTPVPKNSGSCLLS